MVKADTKSLMPVCCPYLLNGRHVVSPLEIKDIQRDILSNTGRTRVLKVHCDQCGVTSNLILMLQENKNDNPSEKSTGACKN